MPKGKLINVQPSVVNDGDQIAYVLTYFSKRTPHNTSRPKMIRRVSEILDRVLEKRCSWNTLGVSQNSNLSPDNVTMTLFSHPSPLITPRKKFEFHYAYTLFFL